MLFTDRTPTAPNFAVLMCAPWLNATDVTISPGSAGANGFWGGRGDTPLDLVDVDVALVVPLPRESLCISVPEVAQEHLPREGTDDVLRRNHREALRKPGVVPIDLLLEEREVLVHGDSYNRAGVK